MRSLTYAHTRFTFYQCLGDTKNVILFLFSFFVLKNRDIERRLNVKKSGVSAI